MIHLGFKKFILTSFVMNGLEGAGVKAIIGTVGTFYQTMKQIEN